MVILLKTNCGYDRTAYKIKGCNQQHDIFAVDPPMSSNDILPSFLHNHMGFPWLCSHCKCTTNVYTLDANCVVARHLYWVESVINQQFKNKYTEYFVPICVVFTIAIFTGVK